MINKICPIVGALVAGLIFLYAYGPIVASKGLPIWRAVLPALIVAVITHYIVKRFW